ncbi:phosphatidylinositol-binding protein scs2 [Tulasnella sp. 403]|nr:phosphatidylinositol-binding protein scs2 [Tulasnella sp. 403]
MSIQLEPSSQLGFNRPLTQLVKKTLVVRNPNSQPVAFKVKTTAPKLYCVRPNSGRIDPGQSVEVSVLLQPMKEDPPPGTKCKDKFLVQSTFITPDKENVSLQDIWTMVDAEGDGRIHQQKIKVVYLPPEGEALEEAEEHAQASQFTDGYSYTTTRPTPSNGHANVLNTFVPVHREPRSSTPAGHERSPSPAQGEYIIAHEDTTQHETTFGDTPSVVNINVHSPGPAEDTGAKYAEAQEEISRLKALVANLTAAAQANNLRRRTKVLSDDGSFVGDSIADDETVVDRTSVATEGGVPLQVVIIIALGVFVTTYLFF